MHLAQGATVAVVDGQKLSLFRNAGQGDQPKLDALPSNAGQHNAAAVTPTEEGFAADVANMLNAEAIAGKVTELLVIAAPKTLGELRKHYHVKTRDALVGEISKDLTGQTSDDIERAIAAA